MDNDILDEIKININLEDVSKERAIKVIKSRFKTTQNEAEELYNEWKIWYLTGGYLEQTRRRHERVMSFDDWILSKVRTSRKGLNKHDIIEIALSYGNKYRKKELLEQFKKRGLSINSNLINVISRQAYDKGYVKRRWKNE